MDRRNYWPFQFSKIFKSYKVKEDIANNFLVCLKNFYYFIVMLKILETDNDSEYKNSLINEFCNTNEINNIFSSPIFSQSNWVAEASHREIMKYILNKILEDKNENEKDLNNILLETNNIHNIAKFKPNTFNCKYRRKDL